jgi:O-acetyl-ADP-ribose deacetylase (regulator of RNase III)
MPNPASAARPADAKITQGYRLPARHVIHAVGPVWNGGNAGEDEALASCYAAPSNCARPTACLDRLSRHFHRVYRFPADRAADSRYTAVERWPRRRSAVSSSAASRRERRLHEQAMAASAALVPMTPPVHSSANSGRGQ